MILHCKAILGWGQHGQWDEFLLWNMPLVQDPSLDLLASSSAWYLTSGPLMPPTPCNLIPHNVPLHPRLLLAPSNHHSAASNWIMPSLPVSDIMLKIWDVKRTHSRDNSTNPCDLIHLSIELRLVTDLFTSTVQLRGIPSTTRWISGQQVEAWSCTRGMMHNKIHLISQSCPWPSIALHQPKTSIISFLRSASQLRGKKGQSWGYIQWLCILQLIRSQLVA